MSAADPRQYRMPAEWEPHAATWVAWPHQRDDWPDKFEPIPWVYTEIVRHLSACEDVNILVNDAEAEAEARRYLSMTHHDAARVRFHHAPTDRVWTRDYGWMWVKDPAGDKAIVDWRFNGWAKYDNAAADDAVPETVARKLGTPTWQPHVRGQRVVLEGGSIDVSGAGLLLTTEECLLSDVQCRNPGLTKADVEQAFRDNLGVRDVLWLGRGIVGDDTHGHVDDLARFVSERTVVTVVEDDPRDENYSPLQDNLARLRGVRVLDVVTLPMPDPVWFDGRRLPASYANFYVANDRVLVPTFNDPADRVALGTLAELFPGRQVAGIHAVDLVWGLGTLHCLTQQEPA